MHCMQWSQQVTRQRLAREWTTDVDTETVVQIIVVDNNTVLLNTDAVVDCAQFF